ncbi:MAG: glycosyltransferase [Kovacikia sp.]
MRILFLDQSGKIGGAELSLLDVASAFRDRCLVGLFEDGAYRHLLEQQLIPVVVLAKHGMHVQRDSTLTVAFSQLPQLLPLIAKVTQLSRDFDLIYANTQKALVVGAIASVLSRRPLVYHLRDILSEEHFSCMNLKLAVMLANRCASLVIANSQATQSAFVAAGGCADRVQVVYNGFDLKFSQSIIAEVEQLRQRLKLTHQFVIGHFSRLSPWKGQHILLQALAQCPENITAVFVGDALFGEQDYVQQLHRLVDQLNLHQRVKFLGFRADIPQLMAACDLVAHTSIAPEPFGRVIVEAMLCGTPVVAADAGGAVELIEPGKTGWLVPPGDATLLAKTIRDCDRNREAIAAIATQAQQVARDRFNLATTNQQIDNLLQQMLQSTPCTRSMDFKAEGRR